MRVCILSFTKLLCPFEEKQAVLSGLLRNRPLELRKERNWLGVFVYPPPGRLGKVHEVRQCLFVSHSRERAGSSESSFLIFYSEM